MHSTISARIAAKYWKRVLLPKVREVHTKTFGITQSDIDTSEF